MTQVRGAAAPTSGRQDHGGFDPEALDEAVAGVTERAAAWAATPPAERERLLGRVVADTVLVAEEWNAAACAAKGYDPSGPEGGEELFSGIGTFVRMAQGLRASLRDLAAGRPPRYPGPVRHRPGDRISIQVLPATAFDRILYAKTTGEVWMEPGVDEDEVRATQARAYADPGAHAGVSLVLAAGNVASLGPRDVLTKMFAEGRVVVLKANPVNSYLIPYWERALAALIEPGFLRIVDGGAQVGSYLTSHPGVDDVHVTGSDKTHDAIVFGTGEEGARRRAANEPVLEKPITCELGNVSPVVIVPGEWTAAEIDYQARHVATMLANNAGFNCLSPRVIVTSRHWAQREEFLGALERVFAALPTRLAYYPGAFERRDALLAAHPDARQIGTGGEGIMPWTIIRDVDPTRPEDPAFNVEAFCALMSETALDVADPAEFLARATDFCNEVLWGTLSMTLLVDPRTRSRPGVDEALERAVADLRYGSIGVNAWHALSFAFGSTTWGAYPGHPATDIQSGRGIVGNALLFGRPQKSVVRGPFVASPPPAWFATNPHGGDVMRRLLRFEASPSWGRLPRLVLAALRH